MDKFWKRGQRAELARKVNIKQCHLSEILYRKRGVDKQRALALQYHSEKILGYPIFWDVWLFNKTTKHPAFFGKPSL